MSSPLFQHRHYVEMARIIGALEHNMRHVVAHHFAGELRYSNPQFSDTRFLQAATGQPTGRDKPRGY